MGDKGVTQARDQGTYVDILEDREYENTILSNRDRKTQKKRLL